MAQEKSRIDHCMGSTEYIAVRVGSWSANDLGTSSPTIIERTVSVRSTMMAAVDPAFSGLTPTRSTSGARAGAMAACP